VGMQDIEEFVSRLQAKLDKWYRTHHGHDAHRLEITPKKDGRLVLIGYNWFMMYKYYCFVNLETGDILQPASTGHAYEREVLGNIKDADPFVRLGPYGTLRRVDSNPVTWSDQPREF